MAARMQPPLSLVGGEQDRSAPSSQRDFCARCGQPPAGGVVPRPRVCQLCGMGLVLSAPAEAAPLSHEPFLVVDRALAVAALSQGAEALLAVAEAIAVGRSLNELLVLDAGEPGSDATGLIASAARGERVAAETAGRLVRDGRPVHLRVGPCWSPPAAVVVLDPDDD